MTSSHQKEFFWGCLIGGVFGAATVLLIPSKFFNGVNNAHHANKDHENHKTHVFPKVAKTQPKTKKNTLSKTSVNPK